MRSGSSSGPVTLRVVRLRLRLSPRAPTADSRPNLSAPLVCPLSFTCPLPPPPITPRRTPARTATNVLQTSTPSSSSPRTSRTPSPLLLTGVSPPPLTCSLRVIPNSLPLTVLAQTSTLPPSTWPTTPVSTKSGQTTAARASTPSTTPRSCHNPLRHVSSPSSGPPPGPHPSPPTRRMTMTTTTGAVRRIWSTRRPSSSMRWV